MEETEEIESKKDKLQYFFDSYAIIEILNENPNYKNFLLFPITLALLNLAEIYWYCINDPKLESEANNVYEKFRKSVVEIEDETLKEAMKFRKEHKKKDISYTDAIGYIYAKEHGMKFLTGDKAFEHMENVEYIKK
ncbi:MAG: PIN domain-containing protein [Nanoarchaeota archaeon]